MAEGNVPVRGERHRHGRPHSRGGGVLARALVDAPVRLLDQLGNATLAAARRALVLADGAGGKARRELARLRASHPVGDREERRLDDVVVFVPAPLLARVGAVAELRNRHASYLSSVSPLRRRLRRRSGGRSGFAAAAVQTRRVAAVTSRTLARARSLGLAC